MTSMKCRSISIAVNVRGSRGEIMIYIGKNEVFENAFISYMRVVPIDSESYTSDKPVALDLRA